MIPHPGELKNDTERYQYAEHAAYELLRAMHERTTCGQPTHWPECDALVKSFGWVSWEACKWSMSHCT